MNFPLLEYLDLTEQDSRPAPEQRFGARWANALEDYWSFSEYRRRGE